MTEISKNVTGITKYKKILVESYTQTLVLLNSQLKKVHKNIQLKNKLDIDIVTVTGKLKKLENVTKKSATIITSIYKAVAQSMTHSFSTFFFDAMQGKLKSLKSYFSSFASSVEQMMSSVLAKQLMVSIVGKAFMGGGGIGGLLGSVGLKDGGIVSGGFKKFVSGGIISEPTLGLIGEGRYNEAVVPLPDGKSIPIKGGIPNIQVNINNQTGQPVKGTSSKVNFDGEKYIVNVILKNYSEYGSMYHLIIKELY